MKRSRRGVFTYFTAWFSRSVPEETVATWLQQGGTLTDQCRAKFLFSVEAGCPDTEEFFQSGLYLEERLSMFHADFVGACVQRGDINVVPVGMYILPPKELHCDIEKRGKLTWMKTRRCKEILPPCKKVTEDVPKAFATEEDRNTVGEKEDFSSCGNGDKPPVADTCSEHTTAVTSSSAVVQHTENQEIDPGEEKTLQPTESTEERAPDRVSDTQLKQGNTRRPASPCCSSAPEPRSRGEAHPDPCQTSRAHPDPCQTSRAHPDPCETTRTPASRSEVHPPDPCDSCRAPHRFLHSRLDDIPHVADLLVSRREVLEDFVPGLNGFCVKRRK